MPFKYNDDDPDFGITMMLSLGMSSIEKLERSMDPDDSGSSLAGEGYVLQRQSRRGEPRVAVRLNRQRRMQQFDSPDRQNWSAFKKKVMQRQYERALEEAKKPLPSPDAGPRSDWPPWARFKAVITEPELFSDPIHLDRFYTSEQVAGFLEPMLVWQLERHPEQREIIERIRHHMDYWVKLDQVCPPGEGGSVTIDGYTWDPEKIGA